MAGSRPVVTQMPATPIPPTSGSKGAVPLKSNLGDMGTSSPKFDRPRPSPGPNTAPGAQGPSPSKRDKRPAGDPA